MHLNSWDYSWLTNKLRRKWHPFLSPSVTNSRLSFCRKLIYSWPRFYHVYFFMSQREQTSWIMGCSNHISVFLSLLPQSSLWRLLFRQWLRGEGKSKWRIGRTEKTSQMRKQEEHTDRKDEAKQARRQRELMEKKKKIDPGVHEHSLMQKEIKRRLKPALILDWQRGTCVH